MTEIMTSVGSGKVTVTGVNTAFLALAIIAAGMVVWRLLTISASKG